MQQKELRTARPDRSVVGFVVPNLSLPTQGIGHAVTHCYPNDPVRDIEREGGECQVEEDCRNAEHISHNTADRGSAVRDSDRADVPSRADPSG
jgi:hypothetical protein